MFVRDDEVRERTYECTPVARTVHAQPAAGTAPGVFLWYQFVPYTVTVVQQTRSLSSFVEATFGVLAGTFAIASWLDRWLYEQSSQRMLD
jgi:hypothetical protein